MSLHDDWQVNFDFARLPISAEPVEEHLSTDAGLLIFRQWDERLGLTKAFAQQLDELRRVPEHSVLEMARSRIFGIIAGYEDQNDHDALRKDAVFKLLADRSPDDADLASQPTLSRFENSVTPAALLRLEKLLIEQFVASFDEPPHEVTLDVDVFDDPAHGEQQLTFFHGFYQQHQYLVRAITCAENDRVILPVLLYGTADPALGLEDDLERIVLALREKFPDVLIRFRADGGYAKPRVYRACERLRLDYSIGIGMNPVLERESQETLQYAIQQYAETGQPQRCFTCFEYRARSWQQTRWVVVKCEATSLGANRRAVVIHRPGVQISPHGAYEEYVERGESENRNRELKCELSIDRLSCHRYMANCFRMFLHCSANNLLVSLRQTIANPPAEEAVPDALPAEARTGRARKRHFNRRRAADPLGEGHACTWRMRLIKVAARITVTARRIRVFLSGTWPFLDHFRDVGRALLTGT